MGGGGGGDEHWDCCREVVVVVGMGFDEIGLRIRLPSLLVAFPCAAASLGSSAGRGHSA